MSMDCRKRRRAHAFVRQAVILACLSSLSLFAQPKADPNPFKLCTTLDVRVPPNLALAIKTELIEKALTTIALPTLAGFFPGVQFDSKTCTGRDTKPRLVKDVRPGPNSSPPIPALQAELVLRIESIRRIEGQLTGTLIVRLKIEDNSNGTDLHLDPFCNSTEQVSISLDKEIDGQLKASLRDALLKSIDQLTGRKKLYQRFFDAAGEHLVGPCSGKESKCLEFREMYQVLLGATAEITPTAPSQRAMGHFALMCPDNKFVFIPTTEVKSPQIVSIDLTEVRRPAIPCR